VKAVCWPVLSMKVAATSRLVSRASSQQCAYGRTFLASFVVVSCNVGATSILAYDIVMHTAPAVLSGNSSNRQQQCVLFCFTVDRPNAPGPPVVSEVHSTSCIVSYEPLLYDCGGGPVSYRLERRTPGPDSEWIKVSDTPVTDLQCIVDNLTPATEYEFRVAAVNKHRMSEFSLVSPKILTAERPDIDKPGLPEVIDVTGTSVCLQWTAPSSDGGTDITEYMLMYGTSEAMDYIIVPADVNMETLISYTIRNTLQANTKYRFAVAAVNSQGQGPWSDMINDVQTYTGIRSNTREQYWFIPIEMYVNR